MKKKSNVERKSPRPKKAASGALAVGAGSVLASITHWLGRDFLKVGGVTMAMEGDTCRECTIAGSAWTPETLRLAARRINRRASSLNDRDVPTSGTNGKAK